MRVLSTVLCVVDGDEQRLGARAAQRFHPSLLPTDRLGNPHGKQDLLLKEAVGR